MGKGLGKSSSKYTMNKGAVVLGIGQANFWHCLFLVKLKFKFIFQTQHATGQK